MLTSRAASISRFTRSDATRLAIASVILVLTMTAILGADFLPKETTTLAVGDIAPTDIVAPTAIEFESDVQTAAARAEARAGVDPQYDFTSEKAIAIAAEQALAFERKVSPIDTLYAADMTPEERAVLLATVMPSLTEASSTTLAGLDGDGWAAVRAEAARVLDGILRTELLDTEVAATKTRLTGLMAGGLDAAQRMLAAELVRDLVVPNSSFSQLLTDQAEDRAEAAVAPIVVEIAQREVIVRNGTLLTAADIEKIDALGLGVAGPSPNVFVGWFMLSLLVVGMLLAWIWRFRPGLWHRDNVLFLIGVLVVGATLALKVTAGRSILQFFLPTAAIGMLLAILLDASLATIVIAIIAIIGGAVNGGSLEFATYTFLGGVAGIIAVRKGDRLQVFVQAAVAVFIVQRDGRHRLLAAG